PSPRYEHGLQYDLQDELRYEVAEGIRVQRICSRNQDCKTESCTMTPFPMESFVTLPQIAPGAGRSHSPCGTHKKTSRAGSMPAPARLTHVPPFTGRRLVRC